MWLSVLSSVAVDTLISDKNNIESIPLRDVVTVNKTSLGKEASASAYSHGPSRLLNMGLDKGHDVVLVNVVKVSSA